MVQEGELALIYQTEADSVSSQDTLSAHNYGMIMLKPAERVGAPLRSSWDESMSFILCGVFILFLIIALRFRNNVKYLGALLRDLVETRSRNNLFDDTVRETSFIFLLNLMWCVSAGIIVYGCISNLSGLAVFSSQNPIGYLIGMLWALIYILFMTVAYMAVGSVFSDSAHVRMWLKGFGASQSLMTPFLFVMALLAICLPTASMIVAIASGLIFIGARLIFIWKGYRIFFNQISSWVLFLCYLCSLEIVPLVLSFRLYTYIGVKLT